MTVKCGGITSAAKKLRISQPALSSQLKVLEGTLNVSLFRRVGRNNELTEPGSLVYGFCRRMFDVSEELNELILERLPTAARRINIGISDEVERSFVVEIVSTFLKKHRLTQRPKVSMTSGSAEQLVERLRFRELDVIVTPLAMTDPDLNNLERADSPVVLVCSKNWKKPEKRKSEENAFDVNKLLEGTEPQWIVPSTKFKLRSEIDQYFEASEVKARVVFESDVVASLTRSVIDEIGVAFLPALYIEAELRAKNLQILGPKKGYWNTSVWLRAHNQNHEDPLIQSFAQSFKSVCDTAKVVLND